MEPGPLVYFVFPFLSSSMVALSISSGVEKPGSPTVHLTTSGPGGCRYGAKPTPRPSNREDISGMHPTRGRTTFKVCRVSDSLQERIASRKVAARVAEQLCNGLQIRGPGCKSRPVLHFLTACVALRLLPMFHQSELSHSLSQKRYSCHYGNRERGIASYQEY